MLVEFLRNLHDLEILQPSAQPWGSDYPIYHSFAQFITSLSHDSRDDLALCDVGWWTAIYLTGTLPAAPPTSQFQLRKRPKLLGAIYCGIHMAMEVSNVYKGQLYTDPQPLSSSAKRSNALRPNLHRFQNAIQRARTGGVESWPKPRHSTGVCTS